MNKTVVCPGSFDPLTLGHMNIIGRGLGIFDEVIVAVANNFSKKSLFTGAERAEIIAEVYKDESRVIVESFEGLLVEYLTQKGLNTILRGIRTVSDFEYEFQMALANKSLNDTVETIFMMTEGRYSHISSSIIKEVVILGGTVGEMVPPVVEERLREKLLQR